MSSDSGGGRGGRRGDRRVRTFGGRYGRPSVTGNFGASTFHHRSSTPQPSVNAPVEAGKEYEVEITEISKRGDGVAKVQGFIIFVQGGKPDVNKVKVRIDRIGPRFASASLVDQKQDDDDNASLNSPEASSESNTEAQEEQEEEEWVADKDMTAPV